jgi:hypothetical protein
MIQVRISLWQEIATPTEAGYIRADHSVIFIFRLQNGGGPYIRNAGHSPRTGKWPLQSA